MLVVGVAVACSFGMFPTATKAKPGILGGIVAPDLLQRRSDGLPASAGQRRTRREGVALGGFFVDASRSLIITVLQAAGGPVRGAKFKQLARKIEPGFDQARLGFSTLRSFLDSYPDVVAVTHDGLDLVASPVAAASEVGGAAGLSAPVSPGDLEMSIRQDIWSAFSFIDPKLARFYDKVEGRAISFTNEPTANESPDLAAQRTAVEQTPDRFVSIVPLSSDEQMALARSFVESISPMNPMKPQLALALEQPVWFREFVAKLREDPALVREWRQTRMKLLLSKIENWMTTNALRVPNLIASRPNSTRGGVATG